MRKQISLHHTPKGVVQVNVREYGSEKILESRYLTEKFKKGKRLSLINLNDYLRKFLNLKSFDITEVDQNLSSLINMRAIENFSPTENMLLVDDKGLVHIVTHGLGSIGFTYQSITTYVPALNEYIDSEYEDCSSYFTKYERQIKKGYSFLTKDVGEVTVRKSYGDDTYLVSTVIGDYFKATLVELLFEFFQQKEIKHA